VVNPTSTPRLHGQTLIEMNRAAFTGRRDAALEQLRRALGREITDSQKARRAKLYTRCLVLLDDAIRSTQRSQAQQNTSLLHYLHLLRDTIGASLALVKHEMALVREAGEFSKLLGPELVARLQTADDVISTGEMNILHCIHDMLRCGSAIRSQDTDARLAQFDADEQRRYELTLSEYRQVYRATR